MMHNNYRVATMAEINEPIAVVYATWSGLGIFLITIFGYFIFHQSLDWRVILGLLLIIGGVILVNTYASHR